MSIFNGLPFDGAEETKKSIIQNTTITQSGWSGNIWTLSNENITATNIVELLPSEDITSEQLTALQDANIIGGTQAVGSIQLKAMGTVPTIDIPVTFIYRFDT